MKEGSTADDPINIQLSDYSSDEGSSNNSDNEGKRAGNDFSDLEGPCCQPLRVPPCSPEANYEVRKLRYNRMRKVMQELDRIYFQPKFRKHFLMFIKAKRTPIMRKRKRIVYKKAENLLLFPNQDYQTVKQDTVVSNTTSEYVEIGSSSNSGNSKSVIALNTLKAQGNKQIKKRREGLKPDQKLNKQILVKVSRKLRLWLSKRQIFIVRRKTVNRKQYLGEAQVFNNKNRKAQVFNTKKIWR